ncbi:outer membrane beta-barrel protein [Dyadobacter flavalbus]|uniref:Outer membrane beta-barrel protein n=1 Tax=Dyadobacter flavalbus TaxID=2579942 RepID=A0A5M8Q3F2_9BACT|nr:outer membrane beta-barrel protein [Dyadobacter flavalbus]KAA6430417.1 outer membrane beta-barrel protein [Dyadobacter flavalbus]
MLKYLTFLLVFFKTGYASAQSSKWTFSLKPGYGWAGTEKTVILGPEIKDEFGRGFTVSSGIRAGYRLSGFLTLSLDAEWQFSQDLRIRTFDTRNSADISNDPVYTTFYRNNFKRIQFPLTLQYSPFDKSFKPYITAGIMPSFITSGRIRYTAKSSLIGEIDSGNIPADFAIPANAKLRKNLSYITGIGLNLKKRVSFELVYQFARPVELAAFDPGSSAINVPVYTTRANEGWIFYVLIRLF